MFPEQSIIGARASVMIYDEGLKKWIPSGNSSGLSKVQIFHHIQNNTFRVVGRKLQDHEVVINCSIVKGLKYNQATATFHQWRDSKFVYGLNFSSQQDAENFARAMMHTLEVLSGRAVSVPANAQTNQQHAPQQQPHPQQNSYDEDMGYRTMTREDADMLNQNQPQQIMSPQTPTSQTMGVQQHQQGHHRASSAPQAPQQMPPTMTVMSQQQPPPQMQNYPPQSLLQQQQQFPIYASGTSQQMNLQPQNGVPIYVPSSISIQNSLNSVATVSKPTVPAPVPPPIQSMNNTYGHGMMQQQAIQSSSQQPVSQYVPTLQQQVSIPGAPIPPPAPPAGFGNTSIPCPPPVPNNISSGGIPCPPPAPTPMNTTINNTSGSSAPPPPPPLPNGGSKSGGMDMGSLAAQLQQAKLRKTSVPQNQSANENSGNSTSSSSSGNYGTIGRTGGGGGGGEMASMMDEMAKTLARRRERQKDTNTQDGDNDKWEKSNTLPHKLSSSNSQTLPSSSSSNAASSLADSPQSRKRFGSASEETILKQVNGGDFSLPPAFDMKAFKAEILKEMRSEITKAKNEIIDAIKVELNRRR